MIIALSGCFDLFHPGHEHIIRKAFFYAGDKGKVIICVNSDKSIQELKGKDRPKDLFSDRKHNVHEFCDRDQRFKIIHFDSEEQLLQTYKIFNPSIIMHGDDITDTRKITGFGSWPVLLLPRIKDPYGYDYSTTNKIKESNE